MPSRFKAPQKVTEITETSDKDEYDSDQECAEPRIKMVKKLPQTQSTSILSQINTHNVMKYKKSRTIEKGKESS